MKIDCPFYTRASAHHGSCALGMFRGRPYVGQCKRCCSGRWPGTNLARMLARLGFHDTPGCACKDHAAEMDRRGPAWCERHIEQIVDWMRAEATKRGLRFFRPFARLLVRRAIATARHSLNQPMIPG